MKGFQFQSFGYLNFSVKIDRNPRCVLTVKSSCVLDRRNFDTIMSTVKACIFCDIVAGKSPDTTIEFSNEDIVIFKDIRPASDHHYLAVPKNHMPNVRGCTINEKDLILQMQDELRNLFSTKNVNLDDVSYGFHWPPFTSISHLHMHGIAPASKMGFVSRQIFKPINMWYCTPEYVISKLKPAT